MNSYITAPEFVAASAQQAWNDDFSDKKDGTRKKTVVFNMAYVSSSKSIRVFDQLVDDGAKHAEIGPLELKLCEELGHDTWNEIDPISASLKRVTHCQFKICEYDSASHRILQSRVLAGKANSDLHVLIHYLVVKGTTQRVVSRSVTVKVDITHVVLNALRMPLEGIK